VPDPGNDNNLSTRGILLKSFKFSWFSIFCGILKTKFCTDLCEEPTWITPFWRGKKTREPLVKSIQKDQEEKIIKNPHTVSESHLIQANAGSAFNREKVK
jgi:hypothetical protein